MRMEFKELRRTKTNPVLAATKAASLELVRTTGLGQGLCQRRTAGWMKGEVILNKIGGTGAGDEVVEL